ncbi:MAG: radical SAM protein [Candidatus Margulisbacteria bacterium]|nr:radical SAM protein [Candidatus Margulisiibacteriota bacterium]MBU1021088.1 radical SAM protein [Candidatus Margulisiibacteriota bacterium]MBU1729897.1 radical SAM protein [Candidatus Margulisiibacteriota bacterium]MBU1955227.1 radical SAM protein [Candidatus Margulisiibacteriota bacterium]
MVKSKKKRNYLSAPVRVFFHLTKRCNFKCKYCFVDAHALPSRDELTVKDIKKVFDQCQELNVLLVKISGGEPLIRKDILQVISLLKRYDFSATLNTNGFFITNEIAKELVKSDIELVNVSLDGPKIIQEQICGVPQSFQKVISGIEKLKRKNIKVALEFVLTKLNCSYFYDLLSIARELKVDLVKIFPLSLAGRAVDQAKDYALSYEKWKDFYLELTKKKISNDLVYKNIQIVPFNCNFCSWELYYPLPAKERKNILKKVWKIDLEHAIVPTGDFHCTAAINCCAISANGDIYPCEQMMGIEELKAGNIKENDLSRVWNGSEVFSKLRGLTRKNLIGFCRNCENPYCSGACPGEAHFLSGNMLVSDSRCVRD